MRIQRPPLPLNPPPCHTLPVCLHPSRCLVCPPLPHCVGHSYNKKNFLNEWTITLGHRDNTSLRPYPKGNRKSLINGHSSFLVASGRNRKQLITVVEAKKQMQRRDVTVALFRADWCLICLLIFLKCHQFKINMGNTGMQRVDHVVMCCPKIIYMNEQMVCFPH